MRATSTLIKQLLLYHAGADFLIKKTQFFDQIKDMERAGLLGLLKSMLSSEEPGQAQWVLQAQRDAPIQSQLLMLRFRTGLRQAALERILDRMQQDAIPVTLLKGIALAYFAYEQPEHRNMGDLDLLIAKEDLPRARELMFELGYIQKSPMSRDFYLTHHHDIPFYHPVEEQWVEIHTGLFGQEILLDEVALFHQGLDAFKQAVKFKNYANVCLLEPEFNLLYIVMHWANEFRVQKGVVVLFDVIALLKNSKAFEPEKLLKYVEQSVFLANTLYIVLDFLYSLGIRFARLVEVRKALMGYHRLDGVQRAMSRFMLRRFFIEQNVYGRILTERVVLAAWYAILRSHRPYANLVRVAGEVLIVVFQKMGFREAQLRPEEE